MSNAGQTCIGIERVYVTERNYEAFVRELTTRARERRGRARPTGRSRCPAS